MKLSEVVFEQNKCYRAFNSDNTIVKVFKFKSLTKYGQSTYIDAFRGITINNFGITLNWTTSYIEDLGIEIEEIDELVIDKVITLYNICRASIVSAVKGEQSK